MRALGDTDTKPGNHWCRHIIGVKLSRNYGHRLALTAGLSMARGRCVLAIDADLQDAPEHLPAMYAQKTPFQAILKELGKNVQIRFA
jgi:glycosyltransferase involved in cell wall biosynthesis